MYLITGNMISNRWIFIGTIFLSLVLIFLIVGCAVIGFTIGSSIDRNTPESESVPFLYWSDIEEGKDIKMIDMNGDTIEGEYISTNPMLSDQSMEQYKNWITR